MVSKWQNLVIMFLLMFNSKHSTYCISMEFNFSDNKKAYDFEESYFHGDETLIDKINDLSNKIKDSFLKSREKDIFHPKEESRREIMEKELIYLNQLKNAYDGKGTIPPVDPLSGTMDLGYTEHPSGLMREHWTEWTVCSASCGETGTRVRSLVCRLASKGEKGKCFQENELIRTEAEECTSDCQLPANGAFMGKERLLILGAMFWAMVLIVFIIAILCLKNILPGRYFPSDSDLDKHIRFESSVSLLPRGNINESCWERSSQTFSNNNSTQLWDQSDECDVERIVQETQDILKKVDELNLVSNTYVVDRDYQSQDQPSTDDEHDDQISSESHENISFPSATLTFAKQNSKDPNKHYKNISTEQPSSQQSKEIECSPLCDSLHHQCGRIDRTNENKWIWSTKVETSSNFEKLHENYRIPTNLAVTLSPGAPKPPLIPLLNQDSKHLRSDFDEDYQHKKQKLYSRILGERNSNENNSISLNEAHEMENKTEQEPTSNLTNYLTADELQINSSPQMAAEQEKRDCNTSDLQNINPPDESIKLQLYINCEVASTIVDNLDKCQNVECVRSSSHLISAVILPNNTKC